MSNDPNDMMLELFRSEVESHSDMLTSSLLALEQEASSSTLERMMRAAHSIKGAARIVQVAPAVDVAHVMEDCFVAAQKGTLVITPDDVDVLLKGVDLLGQISAASRDPGTDWSLFQKDVQGLVVELKGVLSGNRPAPPTAIPAAPPVEAPPAIAGPPSTTAPPVTVPPGPEIAAAPPDPVPATAPLVPVSNTAPPAPVSNTAPPAPVSNTAPPAPVPPAVTVPLQAAPRQPVRLVVAARFLDAVAAEPLRQQLLGQVTQGVTKLELDLQQVEDLDAVGLTFLASARAYAARQGTELHYRGLSPAVATVLRMTGVSAVSGETSR